MSKSREKMQLTVELMRRGAVMMKEPCPIDNGVQVRYKGKVYCTTHDDLETALSTKEVTYADIASSLRDLILVKLKENAAVLENEKDPKRQDEIVALITRCVDLLNKLEVSQRT
ncbi:MAG: hypothetical protein JRN59_02540 [Nitrososphaerota archaeon]|jgi:UPF0148 protein|nr:hypothetical protein [Nitrososphaerota archaeon]